MHKADALMYVLSLEIHISNRQTDLAHYGQRVISCLSDQGDLTPVTPVFEEMTMYETLSLSMLGFIVQVSFCFKVIGRTRLHCKMSKHGHVVVMYFWNLGVLEFGILELGTSGDLNQIMI